jgi:hypothetical protein
LGTEDKYSGEIWKRRMNIGTGWTIINHGLFVNKTKRITFELGGRVDPMLTEFTEFVVVSMD